MERKKPIVHYDPNGETGNIYVVLGRARKALGNQTEKAAEMTNRVVHGAESYKAALEIINEYVHLVIKKDR